MSKKNILIIIIVSILLVIFIAMYFVLNLEKSKPSGISLSSSSVVLEVKENPEAGNPFIKSNQSKDTYSEDLTPNSISTVSLTSSSSSSLGSQISTTAKISSFIELKKLSDNIKVYNLEGFDPNKLEGESLVDQTNFLPNTLSPKYLFIEKDGARKFLGYGAVDIFTFEVDSKKYYITVLEDETERPTLVLTDEKFENQRKIYTGFDYTLGKFSQKDNTSKFAFDGKILNDDENTVIQKTLDVQDVHDFSDGE